MMTERPPLLSIAQKVLNLETILTVNSTPNIKSHGFKILDRWALNSPEKLKELENYPRGLTNLLMRLGQQQTKELVVLRGPEAEEQLRTGLAEHEILAMHGVNTEL